MIFWFRVNQPNHCALKDDLLVGFLVHKAESWNVFGYRLGEGAGRNSVDIRIQIILNW